MIRILDKLALSGMAFGILSMLQPWWVGGFRIGFFITFFMTILHIFTSHMNKPGDA